MKKLLVTVFLSFLSVTALVLSVTSLASPKWGEDKETGFSTGLWGYCNNSTCYGYSKDQKVGALFATGFFAFVTVFMNFFAFIISVSLLYYAIKNGDKDISLKSATTITGVNHGLACISSLITMCCFTGGYSTLQYGYSYYLGWAVFALCGTTSISILSVRMILWKCKDREGSLLCNNSLCQNEESPKEEPAINPSIRFYRKNWNPQEN